MRTVRFTFLCTIEERDALERLAAFWRRSKSNTVRLLIVNALEQLFATDQQSANPERNSENAKADAKSHQGGG